LAQLKTTSQAFGWPTRMSSGGPLPVPVVGSSERDSGVLEAAVVPFEEQSGIQTPKAFVVLAQGYVGGKELTRELQDFVKQRITPYCASAAAPSFPSSPV
jgi:hypothetical protein